jgi:hypothetical protein
MNLARTTLPHLSPASPSRLSLSQVRAAHLEMSAAAVTVGGLLGRGKNAAVYAAEVLGLCEGLEEPLSLTSPSPLPLSQVLGLCEGLEETAAAASARSEVTRSPTACMLCLPGPCRLPGPC